MSRLSRMGIKFLRDMADREQPQVTIEAALLHDEGAFDVAERVVKMVYDHIATGGGSPSATMTIVMAALGNMHGMCADTNEVCAGEAVDLMAQTLVKVFNHSVEQGFAHSRKEAARGD
jgi:hypothetical protein